MTVLRLHLCKNKDKTQRFLDRNTTHSSLASLEQCTNQDLSQVAIKIQHAPHIYMKSPNVLDICSITY